MNIVESFVQERWDRLGYSTFPARISSVIATPRFPASKHVVVFILVEGSAAPALVAKVSRLPGNGSSLEKEGVNLKLVQLSREGGFESVPRLVAFENFGGCQLLLETALTGRPMGRSMVRRRFQDCAASGLGWLCEFDKATLKADGSGERRRSVVEQPLSFLQEALPMCAEEVSATREIASMILELQLPLVFTHGDLSAPNLFCLDQGGMGVVDWELGEPSGLPASDLFFFLAYLAFARTNARATEQYIEAFDEAFFGSPGWAGSYVRAYAEEMRIPAAALKAIFVMTWATYVAGLLSRLLEPGRVSLEFDETVAWVRSDRNCRLWLHAVKNIGRLEWMDSL